MKPIFGRLLNRILLRSMCLCSFEKYLKYMDNLKNGKPGRQKEKDSKSTSPQGKEAKDTDDASNPCCRWTPQVRDEMKRANT